MDTAPTKPCCGTCNAYAPENAEQGVCRARAPVPVLYGHAQSVIGGQPQPIIVTHFPGVKVIGWCREHQPARTLATTGL